MEENSVQSREYCSGWARFPAAQVQYLVNSTSKTLRKMTIWFCKCQHLSALITIYFCHFPKTFKNIWFSYVFCIKNQLLLIVSQKWMLFLDFRFPGLDFRSRARFPASRARIALPGSPDDARCCQMLPEDPRFRQMLPVQMLPDASRWCQVLPDAARWSQMTQMIPDAARCCQPRCCQSRWFFLEYYNNYVCTRISAYLPRLGRTTAGICADG